MLGVRHGESVNAAPGSALRLLSADNAARTP